MTLQARDTKEWYKHVDPCSVVDRSLLDYVHAHAGHTILDLGSGPGGYSRLLGEMGHTCFALDINPEYVEMARGIGVNAAAYDGQVIPFEDKSIDTVIAIEVLEHVREPERLVHEIARVAKNNLIATVPNCTRDFVPAPVVFEHMLDMDHKNFFTKNAFRELLSSSFSRVEVDEIAPIDLLLAQALLPRFLARTYSALIRFGLVKQSRYFRLLANAGVD